MSSTSLQQLIDAVADGHLVPMLGPGVLADVHEVGGDAAIPADSDSLIIAMNNGKPMAPKLMYEFPRAAMNQELKRGRSFVNRFLIQTYAKREWTRAAVHDWLASLKPAYVIDLNRDLQLQQSYADKEHNLVVGIARLGGTEYRFKVFHYDGASYSEVAVEEADSSLPTLFKPTGTPEPEPLFIASDADYVDYLTELMGGFGMPTFLKQYRKGKQYLLLGLRLTRDTERMLLSDISYDAASPRGYALIAEPTAKEERFCARMEIEIVRADITDLLEVAVAECA